MITYTRMLRWMLLVMLVILFKTCRSQDETCAQEPCEPEAEEGKPWYTIWYIWAIVGGVLLISCCGLCGSYGVAPRVTSIRQRIRTKEFTHTPSVRQGTQPTYTKKGSVYRSGAKASMKSSSQIKKSSMKSSTKKDGRSAPSRTSQKKSPLYTISDEGNDGQSYDRNQVTHSSQEETSFNNTERKKPEYHRYDSFQV